jgi:hypothetical protein
MSFRRRRIAMRVVLATMVLACGRAATAEGPAGKENPPSKPAVELNELEQAFVDLMKGSVLDGHFSIDGAGEKSTPKTDRYRINSVTKVKDDSWLVNARVVYGDFDVVVPVPVKMNWAGDTAVLSVTDLSIPGLGEGFSSRLLFDGKRYAGTWAHGEVGGHMWGKIDKQTEAEAKPGR